ncbi:striated muscle preferentially expressed protein kinase isoform X1 [Alosa sapidissima]|uniref:striated muscle preferentially expressed protein kinase isoform X1 n=1 Tax=Alosa sapidissima TaxID=34773 RepID=UPI001C088D67|nr:striated muscle preferentially expressed protein kinase isoform X1 [Alosa sapidissima]XP_041936878.1 striated muscle preferentially expressed protein kinase isoform X1 [Alosa sapidissima]
MRRAQFPSRATPERIVMPSAGASDRRSDLPGQERPAPGPPVFLRKLKRGAVGTGCDVRLRVSVGGHPEPVLHWYHDDLPVASDERDPGGLWIRDCQPTDGGLYTCVAVNALGEARSSAVLAVLDLGEDSENTEDETAEGQVPMEAKEKGKGAHSQTGVKMADRSSEPYGHDRRAVQDPVVGREVFPLGSRPPGLVDPSQPGRNQVDTLLKDNTPSALFPLGKTKPSSSLPGHDEPGPDTSLPSDSGQQQKQNVGGPAVRQEKADSMTRAKGSKSSGSSHSSDSQDSRKDSLTCQTPKLTRAGSKIFDKVRAFEERKQSVDPPKGSSASRPWAMFGRAASVDSGDDRNKRTAATKDQGTSDVALKRSFFKQKASSLEEGSSNSNYAQKVQNFQSKFTVELNRIKRLVGRPSMKKAMSTEQLCETDKQSLGKLEPIPPEVIQKLQDRERRSEMRAAESEKEPILPNVSKKPHDLEQRPARMFSEPEKEQRAPQKPVRTQSELQSGTEDKQPLKDQVAPWRSGASKKHTGKDTLVGKTETDGGAKAKPRIFPAIQLPGQCSPRLPRKSPTRDSPTLPSPQPLQETPHNQETEQPVPKKERKSSSPRLQRVSTPTKDVPVPPKPPRMASSVQPAQPAPVPTPQSAPEKKPTRGLSAGLKLTIPTIVVEAEPMEEEDDEEEEERIEHDQRRTRRPVRKGRSPRSRGKAHHDHPTSPEQADSSDDSYMSAEEAPDEGPHFQTPLRDVEACTGDEVQLKCVIAGSPLPQVRWRKGDTEIRDSPTHILQVEGERFSLTIMHMKPSDAGTYNVTANNRMGQASCSATLFVRAEPVQGHRGKLSLPLDPPGSPVLSDEEYLSPLEEAMELDNAPWSQRTALSPFKEPPSFQVTSGDQAVVEGQEVTMSVHVCGQPKPMVYWLRDRVAIKTDSRHVVQERPEGKYEMKIKSALKSDAGVYTCKIINEYGTNQKECRLEVSAPSGQPALAINIPVQDVSVRAGETALFECHMVGPQEVDVDWLGNGKLIQPALLDCKMHFDGRRCRLLLRSVHEDDSGTYTCKLSSAKEELVSSASLRVSPSREPLFTRKLDVLEVIEGRTARFDCKVSGSPPPEVTWSHLENSLQETDNIRILKEGGRHSLIITQVTQEDEGFYTATAHNIHGDTDSTAELYVQEPRPAISSHMAKLEKMPSIPEEPEVLESEVERRTMPDFITPLRDVEVVEGKEAVLKCKVSGMPYPTISWYHNGKKIDSTDDRKMTQYRDVHSLVIRSVCHGHNGVYKSVISNKVGKAACYAHLYVADILPEPPDGPPVIEAITGRTITLRWSRPKNLDPSIDPNSLLYAVQQQALGSIQWTIIASNLRETSYVVASLSKGARYAFRVLAGTGKAFSKPSPPTDLVQLIDRGQYLRRGPEILDKPDTVYAVENQPASMTITLNHVQATVSWKRRGAILLHKPGVCEMSMPDDDQHSLKLMRVRVGDVGQYTCIVSNAYGSDICHAQLILAAPPAFESIMEDLDVCVGETTRFAVVVDGKPDPDILWYKDNTLLAESSHFTFVYDDRECSLVVLSAREEDSGVYTCMAKNLAGSVSCKAELTVRTAKKVVEEPMEDEETILRRMRRLTDYYDIHKEIGRGAFSYVKRVTLKAAKRDYGAKFITARAKRKASALREMSLLSELDHERILYFHDAFEKKNVIVLITELCHDELLERLTKRTTIMESEVRSIIRQILEGIDYLHHNDIIHLDIKPENILMADRNSDQIRICDFGSALKLTPNEPQYSKYGTPEFVAPEIVSQTPISKATDIWPIGVIAYLCLTGVSPFAAENDRETLLNIRNYNVAFEESMFADLCREAKGFVIKLLVLDRLRPDTAEGLRHPWFKTLTKGKSISTALHKQVLARRKWQRSLISYKSKMVMRAIPELLDDSSKHTSIAVSRHLKESSPPPSSSSDSDGEIDELPFIPMPMNMVFSGSRMSLTEITGEDDVSDGVVPAKGNHHSVEPMECEPSVPGKDGESEEVGTEGEKPRKPLQRGSSVEAEEARIKSRRATMRRGSSADSALLLHVSPEEGATAEEAEEGSCSLKKAVSMELPRRSPSPGPGKLSQEDYALKLELMRQRLLRGGSVDKKMSGLRGPLLETLGVDDERRTSSLDRNLRRARMGGMTRASSTESPSEGSPKTKVFRKSASFSQVDPEATPLHRRFGAPLEIPNTQTGRMGEQKLHEAVSMSVLTEQTRLESRPESPTEINSVPPPTPDPEQQERKQEERWILGNEKMDEEQQDGTTISEFSPQSHEEDNVSLSSYSAVKDSRSVVSPMIKSESSSRRESVVSKSEEVSSSNEGEGKSEVESSASTPTEKKKSAYADVMQTITGLQPNGKQPHVPTATHSRTRSNPETILLPEHPAVFAKVATPFAPILRTDIKDIDSEEVFEARFKKRESSLTRGLKRLTRTKSEEKSPVMPRKLGEEIYRPGPTGAPLEMVSRGLQEKSKSVQDLREVDKDLGLIGRFSMRAKKSSLAPKKEEKPKDESKDESASKRRVSWALGRSKSEDKKATEPIKTEEEVKAKKDVSERDKQKVPDSPVFAMRRRFESKVAGISEKIRSRSEERKETKTLKPTQPDAEASEAPTEETKPDQKKVDESPVLAMKKKFEAKVAGISMKLRSQSEDREVETEPKPEGKRTPLLSRLRHSQSEGTSLKKMDIPENQLAEQTGKLGGNESVESTNSAQADLKSSQTPENDRRSRWDRWGLSRGKRGKSPGQLSTASSVSKEEEAKNQEYTRSSSDFPPVFHIKLRDHILLEGDPVTLSCLPAGNPLPKVIWMKDKKPLDIDSRMNLMSSPDGRQLLMILNTTKKDAGLYECVATNPLASATSSCTISLACVPKRPGTPEVPQTYNNTALVLWKPADTKPPCTYSLERRTEGETNWLIVATGLMDCYHNVTELPTSNTLRFRVACVNKAGQGPYSNTSGKVCLGTGRSVFTKPVKGKATSQSPAADVPAPPPGAAMATCSVVVQRSKSVPAVSPSSLPQALPAPFPTTQIPVQIPSRAATASPTTPPVVTPLPAPSSATRTPHVWPPRRASDAQSPTNIPHVQRQTALPANSATNTALVTPAPQSPPVVKPIAPLVLPKPKSPVNVVPPITQTPPVPQPVPTTTSSPSATMPLPCRPISPVPSYVPTTTARVAPTPVSPPVVLVSSMSPFGEGPTTPTPLTPTGQVNPSTKASESSLRQGVPQKPYTFLDEKTRGRFGVIRECRENATGKMFAAKIVSYEQDTKQQVVQEYQTLKSLHNDRIMALHEAYVTPRYLVLITENCTGKEILYSLIDRFRYSEDDIVQYLVGILQGLEYLHSRRILHLDIKPDNIMVTNMNVIKIVDLGSAQSFNPLTLRTYSRDLATLEFSAPELLKGDVVGPPADMWGVGVLVYIMLSGRLPFQEKDPKQTETKILAAKFDATKLYPNVSQSASAFLKKTLNGYPWSRPTTKDCFSHGWLQDSYLMKLRRQTLTFTTARLKEFLGEHQRRRVEAATKHKVLLRAYQTGPPSPASSSTTPVTQ